MSLLPEVDAVSIVLNSQAPGEHSRRKKRAVHIKQTNPFVVGFYLAGMCCRQLYLLPRLTLPTFLFASLPCPSMSIGFEADRSVVGINEPVRLTVVASNDSSSSVKSMHMEIVQMCTWYAHGQKETNTRTVASMIVSGSQLGEVQRAAVEGNQRGRSAVEVEVAARQYLQELLAAGAGSRYELLVPDDCLLTLETGLIDVRHMLSVRLKTPAWINSPDVSMPLRVQTGTVVLDRQQPETNSGVMPFTEAVPYAATVGDEPGGDLRAVSVPQSAVTMEFSSELPQSSGPAKGQYHV